MKQRRTIQRALILFSMIGFLGINQVASAESIQKHPRVAEMEDSLRQKASTYLKARFPDQPFLVNVSVDALRRTSAKGAENESLPFFDTVSDEIMDEWDDPNVSLQALQLRTNKIVVEISLSDSVSDTEVSEVKDNIVRSLHLTSARDEVRIEAKNWKGSSNRYLQTLVVFGVAILFLIGLYFINRQATHKITRALAEGAKNSATSVNGSMAMAQGNGSVGSASGDGDHHDGEHFNGPKRGLQLSDPLKISEILARTLDDLNKKVGFPTMKDMVALDDYGMHHPAQLGAILSELKPEMRSKLFSLSTGEWWLQAMMKPAHFEIEHLEFLQRLVKEPVSSKSAAVHDMLIKVWRLNDRLPEFIRTYDRDTALAVLSFLPKGKAIDAARKAFPGGWADLLDPTFKRKFLTDEECEAIAQKAVMIIPLQNPLAFEKHKLEMELRDFLLKATVEEEREIYLASKPDSAIHTHRPPFYKVLEADDEVLKEFVGRFSPDQWAHALFNVSQTERKRIQAHFSEKQNFMFTENLKRQDRTNDHSATGRTREFIGSAFRKYKGELEAEAVQAMKEVQDLVAEEKATGDDEGKKAKKQKNDKQDKVA